MFLPRSSVLCYALPVPAVIPYNTCTFHTALPIPAIRALTSLNLASNYLDAEGTKHVAEAIKGHVSALQFFWYHFELDLTSGSTTVVY